MIPDYTGILMNLIKFQIKATGEIFNSDKVTRVQSDDRTKDVLNINGTICESGEFIRLCPCTITAQVWEWYGHDDYVGNPSHGRYKAKGGQEFIVFVDEHDAMYREAEVIAKLNEKHNVEGAFIKHEFRGDCQLFPYDKPMEEIITL